MRTFRSTKEIIVSNYTEAEELVTRLRAEAKDSGHDFISGSMKYECKKEKGEIVDDHVLVTIKIQHCDKWYE